jgi:hypothetical protein
VRSAGIEPDIQRVAHLVVARGIGAEQFGRVELEPGVDAFLLDALRHGFQQLKRARMRLAAFLVQEEGDRHAPVALARNAPVGPVGDHRVQARLAPVGIKLRRLDRGQRLVAQGRLPFLRRRRRPDSIAPFPGKGAGGIVPACRGMDRVGHHPIHTHEPLRRGAVNDRRLVPPAVHVAMHDLRASKQAADLGQLLDDGRIGLPDEHAAEEGQAGGKHAVALHRGEDLVVVHAVLAAGVEVLQAIGRRAMHDACTGIERDVLAEIDGRRTVVERVAELHQ